MGVLKMLRRGCQEVMVMATESPKYVKVRALAKIAKIQESSKYKTFFSGAAVQAFNRVEGSAFAGKPLKQNEADVGSTR